MSTPLPPGPTERIDAANNGGQERTDVHAVPTARVVDDATPAEPQLLDRLTRPGARIGEYRVQSVIGRGGMGVVLLAEQLTPVHRQVALKLLAGRRMDGRAQAWFEVERQLLARMQHPAIAQIFDAGTTAEGVPYFSMEWVEGEPLNHFADQHRLSIKERLALFVRVCMGVHHAHSRGIIHRDLKPANILVAHIDGVPMPKIIDFGIAALDSRQGARRAPPAGTLPYMSPEQLSRSGDELDPRADVFALGVVLFELLTGARPYGDNSSRPATASTPDMLLRGSDVATLRRRASERRIDPQRLLALLRGDLAAIMLKAVATERARRYESAAALAEDLQRLLHHQPVSAVVATRRYRLARFLRRQRLPVALASIAVLALLAGLLLALRSASLATQASERAALEAYTARAVAEFFSERIHGDDPGMQCNYEQYEAVGQAAQRAIRQLDTRYARQPAVMQRLRAMLAGTLLAAGHYDQALAQMQQSRKQARQLYGRTSPETLEAELQLLRIYNGVDRYKDAQTLARSIINRGGELLGRDHPIVLGARAELLTTVMMFSDYAQAQKLGEALLPLAKRRRLADGGVLYERVVGGLADTYRMLDMQDQALALRSDQVQVFRQDPGPNSQRTLEAIADLALLHLDADQDEQALTLLQSEVIPVYENFCGEGLVPYATARLQAMIHTKRGEYAQAATLLADWVSSEADVPLAEQTMSDAMTHHEYGNALIGAGQAAQGIAHLLLADQIYARDVAVHNPDRQLVISALVDAYQATNQDLETARWRALLKPEPAVGESDKPSAATSAPTDPDG